MNFIRYHVVHAKVVILYMIALVPLLMLSHYLGEHPEFHRAAVAVKVLIGVLLVVSIWMSHQTSTRILFEDMTFREATVDSLGTVRLYLALLPAVGRFVGLAKKRRTAARGRSPAVVVVFLVEGQRDSEQNPGEQSIPGGSHGEEHEMFGCGRGL
jgi:hypothetical protein